MERVFLGSGHLEYPGCWPRTICSAAVREGGFGHWCVLHAASPFAIDSSFFKCAATTFLNEKVYALSSYLLALLRAPAMEADQMFATRLHRPRTVYLHLTSFFFVVYLYCFSSCHAGFEGRIINRAEAMKRRAEGGVHIRTMHFLSPFHLFPFLSNPCLPFPDG